MTNAWSNAMRGLSRLELQLIMRGAKNGTLRVVGDPANSFGAGLKAAMELNGRDSDGTRSAETACPAPVPKDCPARVRRTSPND